MNATPTIHYFAVSAPGAASPGRIIERHRIRPGDAPLTPESARCFAIDVAEEAARYANVPIDWTIEDADDGWLVTSSQHGRVVGRLQVRYVGTSDPRRTEPRPARVELSRHATHEEASSAARAARDSGQHAELVFDSYAERPHAVVVRSTEGKAGE